MHHTPPPLWGRMQVDNMHYQMYKEVRPCQQGRARLASFWMRQERLKRQLDGDMSAARAELAALPSHIPLPHEFLSHLNALVATPSSTWLHAAGQQCSQHSYSSGAVWQLIPQCNSYSEVLHLAHCHSARETSQISIPAAARFLGQCPEDMVRAERALLGLRYVMEAVKDLEADMSNAEMPGVLLEVVKHHRLWTKTFHKKMMLPDMMEVCQLAATQQYRCNLFEAPFP